MRILVAFAILALAVSHADASQRADEDEIRGYKRAGTTRGTGTISGR
jgi:hypothetical protein